MYGTLALSHRALDDLAESAGERAIGELRTLARPIEGLRVLNLSVTGFGTGTAELLNSSVPLLSDLGLDCHWQVVRASEDSTSVTRAMYQALGGTYVPWTYDMTETWQRYASMNADLLTEEFDVIIVHDPQPAAMRSYLRDGLGIRAKWVFHSHLDLSAAQEDVWMLLRSHVEQYDAAIFDAPLFARSDLNVPTHIIPPAIDPNSARNMPLSDDMIRTVLERHGIDIERPLLVQVSPCDAASDLGGAIDVWRRARDSHSDLQLALILTTEPQDDSGRACYEEAARACTEERDLALVATRDFGNVELNVFQRAASVVMQKGLRKGFGLWISDALWKGRPCVVAPAGGLTQQVLNGDTGIVASTTEEFAVAITRLLDDRAEAERLGANGHQHVADHFLITRYLRDYLQILNQLHREG